MSVEKTRDLRYEQVERLFKNTAKTYEKVVFLSTLAMDSLWKHNMLKIVQFHFRSHSGPKKVLDLACGTGIVTRKLAKKFPNAEIVGIDITREYLKIAERKTRPIDRDRITFMHLNAEDLGNVDIGTYDLIISSYIPKYIDLRLFVHDCEKLLKPRGMLIVHDFTYPKNRIFKIGYELYWKLLKPILKLSGWGVSSNELKDLVKKSKWLDEIVKHLIQATKYNLYKIQYQLLQISCIVYAHRT